MDNRILNIIKYIEDEDLITFEEPLLLNYSKRTWYIHSIKGDLIHEDLYIFYSDDAINIKKVNFFDFHNDLYELLLDIIEYNI